MKIYAFIFARGGSKGIIGKNKKKLNNKELILHAIDTCKKSKYIQKIFVSTDDDEIIKISLENNVIIPYKRPDYLCDDNSSEIDAWKHILKYLSEQNDLCDIFVSVPTVAPLRSDDLIDNCIKTFINNNNSDLLITVKKSDRNPCFDIVKKQNKNDYIELYDKTMINCSNRQEFIDTFDVTTACYISKPDIILNKINNKNLLNNNINIISYLLDKSEAIDLDDNVDWFIAEKLYEQKISNKLSCSIVKNLFQDNKVGIITGGLGYVGLSICETLLELRSTIIIIDVDNETNRKRLLELEHIFEQNIIVYFCNLLNLDEYDNMISNIKQKFNTIDYIINCASFVGSNDIKGWNTPFIEQSDEAFNNCLYINNTIPFKIIRDLIDNLKKSLYGASVINISSIYSIRGNDFSVYEESNMFSPLAYSVSKAGLNQLTRYLSSLYGKNNIRFNNIILGGILRNQPSKFIEKYIRKTPLCRMGQENDIKGAIFLLISNLSSYITGQDIIIDGGITTKI